MTMIRKTLTLFTAVLCLNAQANLYKCEDVNGEPVKVDESHRIPKVEIHKTDPYWINDNLSTARMHESHNQNKTPFLIYYAIDSAEPFMKYSVNYEIAQLEKNCIGSSNVNFVALLNSLYVESNEFILCKNQRFQKVNLSQFPDLDFRLKVKHKSIGEGDHTINEMGPMSFLVKYEANINKPFSYFPLAHPDFLHELIELVINEKGLFPTNKYMPFLNLKSHGSSETVLSGLHSCQVRAKTKTQKEIVTLILKGDAEKLNSFNTSHEISQNLISYNELIDKLNLGTKAFGGDATLGDTNLGDTNLGDTNLGDAISGLGANNGLGSEFAFGSYHVALNAVLADLFNPENGRVLGFLMLESCDTNRDAAFHHANLENVLGFYSAKHSLWYRNLNWWAILSKAQGSTRKLIELLDSDTKKIINIKVLK
jgi:hypothetical protein